MKSAVTILFIILISTFATYKVASADVNNQALKLCLDIHGYDPQKFETFNFSRPAKCFSDFSAARKKADYEKMREFLEDNPWYRGKNWRWEEKAEYTCTKQYQHMGIEVCHKPFYYMQSEDVK